MYCNCLDWEWTGVSESDSKIGLESISESKLFWMLHFDRTVLINLANLAVESTGNESYTHWVIIWVRFASAEFQQADDETLCLTLSDSKQANQCNYLWCKIFNKEPNVSELMQLLKAHREVFTCSQTSPLSSLLLSCQDSDRNSEESILPLPHMLFQTHAEMNSDMINVTT